MNRASRLGRSWNGDIKIQERGSDSHTAAITTRFNPGRAANPPFEILYLAESPIVALYEVEAIFGPLDQHVVNPHRNNVATIDIEVHLQAIADLTEPKQQALLNLTVQELTGNWDTYPPGDAPTQRLGAALYGTGGLERFLSISAKLPRKKSLIVFPEKLIKGSELRFNDLITNKTHVIRG